MPKTIKPLLILLAIGFSCQNFGPLSYDLNRLLMVSCLILYFFLSTPLKEKEALSIPLFIICILLISRLHGTLLQLSGLSALLFLLTFYAGWRGYAKDEHTMSFLTTVFFTVTFFLYAYFPEGWYLAELYAGLFSSLCSFIYDRTLNLGPTAFGFFILTAFIIYHAVIFILDRKRSLLRFIFALLYLFCTNLIFIGFNLLITSVVRKYTLLTGQNDLHTQVLLFLMLSPSIIFQKQRALQQVQVLMAKRSYKYAVPAILIFAIALFFYTYPFYSAESTGGENIVFYKSGSLDWDVPKFGTYGQRSGGMFGLMPKYLSVMGFNTRMIDKITITSLFDADVLVMINLNKRLLRAEIEAIWNFVSNGGGLLLLGDHTNLAGLMQNFNQLLRVVNIKFNFDSAMPSRYTWDYLLAQRNHLLTNGFAKEIAGSWWVGASLQCAYPAEPLVIGKYCYADWGYKHNKKNAYLGNRRFDYYEPLNDLVLAAYARYGKGKVLVFGDTSSFHNTTFPITHGFVNNVFHFLANGYQELDPDMRRILQALLILSILFCVVFTFRSVPNMIVPLGIIAALCTNIFFAENAVRPGRIRDTALAKLKIAYIDYSHIERFDLMSWEDDSIGGLKNNLLRNGFFPLLLTNFCSEKLLQSKLLVIIAPTRPFSEQEIRVLQDFTAKGGQIVLTVGWEEREASLPLLKSFGLGIDNIPLGWCKFQYKETTVQFHEAWPVIFGDENNLEVICRPLGFPAIVSRRYGQGSLILIADSCFLLNENLEGSKKYSIANIFLFRDLLHRLN